MSETGKIRVSFDTLKAGYPTYKSLPRPLQNFMDGLNKVTPGNTPCCVQISHALNQVGQPIPPRSFRRGNAPIGPYYYILAVDELEQYLSGRYGRGEEIKKDPSGKMRSTVEMKQYLDGKQGILLFRSAGAGHHTELWDMTHIIQDGHAISGGGAIMNESNIFGQQRVLFWEIIEETAGLNSVPGWLVGWWHVTDGNTYYYYFSDQHVVTYTKVEPKKLAEPPVKTPLNEGAVTIAPNAPQIVIDWNPADGGATKESFTCDPSNSESKMYGVSNRYAPLLATKM
jgi:Type VI secretion system (T6SS), amidase effector protein 4